jgi:2'-5' RNA ligase
MMTYATDTSGWEDWQSEYRYGALYIFPPAGVIERVDALRRIHDPRSAAICQAHVSLSEPLPGPLTSAQLEELQAALRATEAFDVHYGPLRSFPPHPGVVYALRPEEAILRLRAIVHATSAFAGAPLRRKDIAPHMTIAEFITLERTRELLKNLQAAAPEGVFRCEAVEYAVPNDQFIFERLLAIPLGASAPA